MYIENMKTAIIAALIALTVIGGPAAKPAPKATEIAAIER